MSFYSGLEHFGDSIALSQSNGERISYKTLAEEADALSRKIRKRSLVFILCRNVIASAAGYLGFLRGGQVPLLLDENIHPDLLWSLLHIYKPEYIWLPAKNENMVQGERLFCSRGYTLIEKQDGVHAELNESLALLLTTSGSIGSPKLVRQSYLNIESNANAIANYLELNQHEKPITTLPMSYTYGLSILNSHLLVGAEILMCPESIMQKGFWSCLKENGATSFGGVPYTYEMLDKLKFFDMKIPSLRTLTQAGGKLSLDLTRKAAKVCAEQGIRFFVMYGQTEATARMSYLPHEYAISKSGSVGKAIPGGEFWLEDEEGKKITEAFTPGELVYKGPNVTLGYAENLDDLKKGDENGGILKTGDLAQRDEDGFYYIVGRLKRFIKVFGKRINLDDMERLLRETGIECVCAGKDDMMLVAVTEKSKLNELPKIISGLTGINHSAFAVKHVDTIPQNEAGKILYSELNKLV